MQQQLISGNCL